MRILVLDRVHERHPELDEADVVAAFRAVMVDAEREDGAFMAVGLDGRGRDIEMLYRVHRDMVVICHAFTPPTKKFMRHIHDLRRK